MTIEFENETELNNLIMKYIEERIDEIVLHYQTDVLDVLESNGYVLVDGNEYYNEIDNKITHLGGD